MQLADQHDENSHTTGKYRHPIRDIALYAFYIITKTTYKKIAEIFRLSSYTTVADIIHRIEIELKNQPGKKNKFNRLMHKLTALSRCPK